MSEWQPIETAPKDGTPILGFGPLPGLGWGDPHVRETKYQNYGKGSLGFAAYERGEGPLGLGWLWFEPVHSWAQTWKPTHWMPLPAAPIITAASAAEGGKNRG